MNSKRLFIYHLLTKFIPLTRCFKLKAALLRWCGAIIGENVRIASTATFYTSGKLTIGSNTWIGHEVLILGGQVPIVIGSDCDIAPRVSIISGTHQINNVSSNKIAGKGYSLPITIGNGCWLCTNALVLGGANIGDKCILKPNAIISIEVKPTSIIKSNTDIKKIY